MNTLIKLVTDLYTIIFSLETLDKTILTAMLLMFCFLFYQVKHLYANKYPIFKNMLLKNVLWTIITIAAVYCLHVESSVIAGPDSNVTTFNMQLVLLFYLAYMLNNYSQLYVHGLLTLFVMFNEIIKAIHLSSYSLNIMFSAIGCLGLLSTTWLIIQNSSRYASSLPKFILTEVLFGTSFWIMYAHRINLDLYNICLSILQFIIIMLFVHLLNKFILKQYSIYKKFISSATVDTLTTVSTRALFDKVYPAVFKQSVHHQTLSTFSLVLFDIDDFKQFNDTYGHPIGDQVLLTVAQTVKTYLETTSTGGQLFRIGGEEFAIIFRNKQLAEVHHIMLNLCQLILFTAIPYNDKSLHLSISVGASEITEADKTPQEFFTKVDNYLYLSKKRGKQAMTINGQTTFYNK